MKNLFIDNCTFSIYFSFKTNYCSVSLNAFCLSMSNIARELLSEIFLKSDY